jgi:hypothetical protein
MRGRTGDEAGPVTTPLWVTSLAGEFWRRAGGAEPFPRTLRRSLARALPLAVVALPRLRVASVDAWLGRNGAPCAIGSPDRPLRACLVARRGRGLVFIDGADPEDEQRFSLAHEVAHFLRDYWQPREEVRRRLGDAALDVLDGVRPPSATERAHALLARVTIEAHRHLMERTADGHPAGAEIDAAERAADRLAYELLAPIATLEADARRCRDENRRDYLARLLASAYGLPAWPAAHYAALLAPEPTAGASLVRRLWSAE